MQVSEDLEIDIQEKIVTFIEDIQAVSRALWVFLAITLIAALPLKVFLGYSFFQILYSGYTPPPIIYERPDAEDIEVKEQRVLSLSDGRYFAFARIINPNPSLSQRQLNYTFDFRNSGGSLLGTAKGSTFLLPVEDKIIMTAAMSFSETPTNVDFEFEIGNWSKTLDLEPLNFRFENVNFGRDEDGRFFVSGLINNDNPFIITETEVAIILYDLQGRIIGVNYTTLNLLQARESRFFRVVWPGGVKGEVSDIEFKPAVNQLHPGTLITGSAEGYDEFDPRR